MWDHEKSGLKSFHVFGGYMNLPFLSLASPKTLGPLLSPLHTVSPGWASLPVSVHEPYSRSKTNKKILHLSLHKEKTGIQLFGILAGVLMMSSSLSCGVNATAY